MRVKIDDALMARDTTCVDAIDKDGVVFSATPSGAWMPSVIAGDTAFPSRSARRASCWSRPSQRAGWRQAAQGHAESDAGYRERQRFHRAVDAGGDNQEQSLIQVLFDVIEFGMNAQAAVEAPRFQTRHLVSSFDIITP